MQVWNTHAGYEGGYCLKLGPNRKGSESTLSLSKLAGDLLLPHGFHRDIRKSAYRSKV
jgi:hypothetical protein